MKTLKIRKEGGSVVFANTRTKLRLGQKIKLNGSFYIKLRNTEKAGLHIVCFMGDETYVYAYPLRKDGLYKFTVQAGDYVTGQTALSTVYALLNKKELRGVHCVKRRDRAILYTSSYETGAGSTFCADGASTISWVREKLGSHGVGYNRIVSVEQEIIFSDSVSFVLEFQTDSGGGYRTRLYLYDDEVDLAKLERFIDSYLDSQP